MNVRKVVQVLSLEVTDHLTVEQAKAQIEQAGWLVDRIIRIMNECGRKTAR